MGMTSHNIDHARKYRVLDAFYLLIAFIIIGAGYTVFRWLYFAGEAIPFAQEMILVFLGAVATIYITAVLLNRQTELELRKEGRVLLFDLKNTIYMAIIEKTSEIVEKERFDAMLIDDLRVLNHKLGVIGSVHVVETFHEVLTMLLQGLEDSGLSQADVNQIMRSVAELTYAMRNDLLGEIGAESKLDVRKLILKNSNRMERLDEIESRKI